MTQSQPAVYRCPACEGAIAAATARCPHCGVSFEAPYAREVYLADTTIQSLREDERLIALRLNQWTEYREQQLELLRSTAVAPTGAAMAAEPMKAASQPMPAAPAPMPAPAEPMAAEPVPAVAADPYVRAPQTAPRAPRRAPGKASTVMTVPALLGVSGASLLIAASIIFVALTWSGFEPVVRGLVVSGVAVAVSGIGVWLRRMGLVISSGAVGLVSIAYAGVATLAFSRESGALGSYETPVALLVVCVAGLVLSRLRFPWVGSAAGLAFAGSAIGFTVAAATSSGSAAGDGGSGVPWVWPWVFVGTLSAVVVAVTRGRWKWAVARDAALWLAVTWLPIVGIVAALYLWLEPGRPVDAVVSVLPLAALVALARRWHVHATVGAGLLATVWAAAATSTFGASWWTQAFAVAVLVAAVLAVGPRLPRRYRTVVLTSIAPGYLVVSIAAAVYSAAITISRIAAGVYTPDTNLWVGATALVAGLAVAQVHAWKIQHLALRGAESVGAVMVATGVGIVAFAAAESWGGDYHSAVAVTSSAAALLLVAAERAWVDGAARTLTRVGWLAFVLNASGHAWAGMVKTELPWWGAVVVSLVPIVVAGWRAARHPWLALMPAVGLATGVAASVAVRVDGSFVWALASALVVASAAIVALPRRTAAWAAPVAVGLLPAAVAGVLWTVSLVLPESVGLPRESVAGRIAVALASFGLMLLTERTSLPRAARIAAAVAAIPSAVALFAIGRNELAPPSWGSGGAVAGVVVAVALGVTWWLWSTGAARRIVQWSSLALLVIANVLVVQPWSAASTVYATASGSDAWVAGLVAGVLSLAALYVVSRWWVAPPTAALAFVAVMHLVGLMLPHLDWPVAVTVASLAAALAALAIPRERGRVVMAGAAPFFAVLLVDAVFATAAGSWLLAAGVEDPQPGMHAASVAAVGAGLGAILTIASALVTRAADKVALRAVAVGSLATLITGALLILRQAVNGHTGDAALIVAATVIAALLLALELRGPAWLRKVTALTWVARAVALWTLAAVIVHGLTLVRDAGFSPLIPALILAAVFLAVATRWWGLWSSIPASAVVSATAYLWVSAHASWVWAAAVVAAIIAVALWVRPKVSLRTLSLHLLGFAPFAVVSMAALVAAIVEAIGVYLAGGLLPGVDSAVTLPRVLLVAATLAVALRTAAARSQWGTWVLAAVVVAAGQTRPWIAIVSVGAAAITLALLGPRARTEPTILLVLAGLPVFIADQSDLTRAAAVAVVAFCAIWIARSSKGTWERVGALIGSLAAASALGLLLHGVGAPAWVITPAGVIVACAAPLILARCGIDTAAWSLVPAVWTATGATLVASVSPLGAGIALVIVGVVWLEIERRGLSKVRYVWAAAFSLGVGLIAFHADIQVIEAFTTTPALAALAIGALQMRRDESLRSLRALGPGLAVGLIPSYIALIDNTDSLPRTAALVAVLIALAAVGVSRQLFAPALATVVTAVVISVVQISVGTDPILRIVSFLVVGTLLLVIASKFEAIKTLR